MDLRMHSCQETDAGDADAGAPRRGRMCGRVRFCLQGYYSSSRTSEPCFGRAGMFEPTIVIFVEGTPRRKNLLLQ